MITYQKIGSYGRLGNQMFQYAAMLGISDRTGLDFGYSPGRLLECFDIKLGTPLISPIKVDFSFSELDFSFDPVVFECPDNVDFIGYFQSEKYWHHCRKKVVEQFKFLKDVEAHGHGFTSLHVRRGDYVGLKETHTCLVDADYYDLALQKLEPDSIIVFTDDVEWVKSSGLLEKWGQKRIIDVCTLSHDMHQLCLMTKADHSIIANSSFSWWGAYLGPYQRNGRIVAPRQWFGPCGPSKWEDIYCEGWEVI